MIPDPDLFRRACSIAITLPNWLRNPPKAATDGEVQAHSGRLSKLCLDLALAQRQFDRGMARAQIRYGPHVKIPRLKGKP